MMVILTQQALGSQVKISTKKDLVRFAVLADTHIPDRVDSLHPALLPAMKVEQIDVVLHCGDITSPTVISTLEEIAPVIAVSGNRDFFFSESNYPFTVTIEVFDKKIGLYHGIKSMRHYVSDKLFYILHGYCFEKNRAVGNYLFPSVDVLCFGHTHTAEIREYRKQLVFNPGTAGPFAKTGSSSWGILDIHAHGKNLAYFMPLNGYTYKDHRWFTLPD